MQKKQLYKDPHHLSGDAIVRGIAKYIGDDFNFSDIFYAQPVFSAYAHANIISIDVSNALKIDGVKTVLCAQDIPGENQIGHTVKDQPLLATNKVYYVGQPIALVVAKTRKIAARAAKTVKIEYEKLPAIFSIDEADSIGNYYVDPCQIVHGDIEKGFKNSYLTFSGVCNTGAQEHVYFETHRTLAMPGDDNNITLYASTQNTAEVQEVVARILGLKSKDVTVDVRRLGGGFGGKEVGATIWSCLAALSAYCLKCPVLLQLTRTEDISFSGKRHPFRARYKVGIDKSGKILAYEVEFCANGGAFTDISIPIVQRAMFHADNAYYIPNAKIIGKACRTNLPPNTAFRGFGAPQGIFVIENVIEHIAVKLHLDPTVVREINFYKNGNDTHFGQIVHEASHHELMLRLKEKIDYEKKLKSIDSFNKENKYMKRGIGIIPVKFGISFTFTPLNQATALIWVYSDGTISMSHGGIEMGQEVNTKVAQIVSREFGIDINKIRMESSNTQRNGNASPTAASTGTDLNGNAALDAVKKIKMRLGKFAVDLLREKIVCQQLSFCKSQICSENRVECDKIIPNVEYMVFEDNNVFDYRYPEIKISFTELVQRAYLNRISLGAHGYYSTPDIFFDGSKMQGSPFYYFLFGIASVIVEVDILTGMNKLLEVHILHESGHSLNQSIDKGQICGAFFQGAGYCTMEEMKFDCNGSYMEKDLSTYKIPSFRDLPEIFDIELIEKDLTYSSVFGSKAIGEPPLIYGEAVYFAIRNALKSVLATTDNESIELPMPATSEAIILSLFKDKKVKE